MRSKVKTEYYVNNKDFLAAIVAYREKVQFAKQNDLPRPRLTPYIAECFLKIATHLSYKPNFVNYMFREDMVCDDCYLHCLVVLLRVLFIILINLSPAKLSLIHI